MGGAVSSGESNDDLIDNLLEADYIKSPLVERVFRAVDRGFYYTKGQRQNAYKDLAWKEGNLHMSAPCIYSEVMENLDLRPGQSFLNIGSGTGYLSTMSGLILGKTGVNHGIELYPEVVEYAQLKLIQFKKSCAAVDLFEFCEPEFVVGNCLDVTVPVVNHYDRIYVGACCPEENVQFIVDMLKIGGICIVPMNDSLVQLTRKSETSYDTKTLLPVSFATLIPSKGTKEPVKLPAWNPRKLSELCRAEIRAAIRRAISQPEEPKNPGEEGRKKRRKRRQDRRRANRLLVVQRRSTGAGGGGGGNNEDRQNGFVAIAYSLGSSEDENGPRRQGLHVSGLQGPQREDGGRNYVPYTDSSDSDSDSDDQRHSGAAIGENLEQKTTPDDESDSMSISTTALDRIDEKVENDQNSPTKNNDVSSRLENLQKLENSENPIEDFETGDDKNTPSSSSKINSVTVGESSQRYINNSQNPTTTHMEDFENSEEMSDGRKFIDENINSKQHSDSNDEDETKKKSDNDDNKKVKNSEKSRPPTVTLVSGSSSMLSSSAINATLSNAISSAISSNPRRSSRSRSPSRSERHNEENRRNSRSEERNPEENSRNDSESGSRMNLASNFLNRIRELVRAAQDQSENPSVTRGNEEDSIVSEIGAAVEAEIEMERDNNDQEENYWREMHGRDIRQERREAPNAGGGGGVRMRMRFDDDVEMEVGQNENNSDDEDEDPVLRQEQREGRERQRLLFQRMNQQRRERRAAAAAENQNTGLTVADIFESPEEFEECFRELEINHPFYLEMRDKICLLPIPQAIKIYLNYCRKLA